MTAYQQSLIEEAQQFWDRGVSIPLDLFSKLAYEGLDVEALEAKHKKEPA